MICRQQKELNKFNISLSRSLILEQTTDGFSGGGTNDNIKVIDLKPLKLRITESFDRYIKNTKISGCRIQFRILHFLVFLGMGLHL